MKLERKSAQSVVKDFGWVPSLNVLKTSGGELGIPSLEGLKMFAEVILKGSNFAAK